MGIMFAWAGGILAFLLYIPLIRGILKGEVKQSFATWTLWVLLDAIALVSTILEKGNFLLLVSYVIGGTLVTATLIHKKQFKWTWFEWLTLALVIVCLVVWKVSGSKTAIVASTLAVFIAGVPQIVESWQKPDKQTALIYFGYIIANSLSLMAGKSWTIEERFYPAVCVILCTLIGIASLHRKTTLDRKGSEVVT